MRFISLNVGLFEANNNKLKKFLKAQKPDILALQEVTRSLDRNASKSLVSKDSIDEITPNLKYSFFGPISILRGINQKDFHGKKKFQFDVGGFVEFGNYIKTRNKICLARNIFVQNSFTYVTDMSNWPVEDYRAVEVLDMRIGKKKLRILNYHGVWTRDKLGNDIAMRACKQIHALATELDSPTIIAGDFNLFPDTDSMKLFYTDFISLVDLFKISSTRPSSNELNKLERNVVDYILVSKDIQINSFRVLKSDVSDHLPLILDFSLK